MKIAFTEYRLRNMPRPDCYMDELRAIATIKKGLWWFETTSPGYESLITKYKDYESEQSKTDTKSVKQLLPCIYRDPICTRTVQCESCTGKRDLKVFPCKIYGECLLSDKKMNGLLNCGICSTRKSK